MTPKQRQILQDLLRNNEEEEEKLIEIKVLREKLSSIMYERMTDYYKATNDIEKVKALCYMYLLLLKSIYQVVTNFKNLKLRDYMKNQKDRLFMLDRIDIDKPAIEYADKALYEFMLNIECEADKMGFDFYQCMRETIKEITVYKANYDKCRIKDKKK